MKLSPAQRRYLKLQLKEEIEARPSDFLDLLISVAKRDIDGWDDEELCDHYNIETEEDLIDIIEEWD